jgi:hypothetical protein
MIDTLNANLPELLSVTELRDGSLAVWSHKKSRKGASSRVAIYTPTSDTYEGEEEATFRAALLSPQPGSPAATEQTRAARKAAAQAGGGDLTGGHDSAPRSWRAMNSDF